MSKRTKSLPTVVVDEDTKIVYSSERKHNKFVPANECREKCTEPTQRAIDLHTKTKEGKGRTKRRDNGPRKSL